MNGMTTAKIAVTVPEETLQNARLQVRKGRARSLSAYVSAALDQKAMLDDLDEMLVQMLEASGGPLTAKERRTADVALGVRRSRSR